MGPGGVAAFGRPTPRRLPIRIRDPSKGLPKDAVQSLHHGFPAQRGHDPVQLRPFRRPRHGRPQREIERPPLDPGLFSQRLEGARKDLLVGRELFGAAVVKTVILVDLLVSMGVWSHHLLADTRQPTWMKLLSGQFITWGEFFTMGLTIFASLMTIWLARPVKMTPALKFVLASIFGFIMGGTAGLIQANTGLNLVFHNTQWVIALHAHTFLLTAVSSLVFAVLYALVPMLTKKEFRFPHLVNAHLWIWIVGAVLNAYAMGMAGSRGMLRRTLYLSLIHI